MWSGKTTGYALALMVAVVSSLGAARGAVADPVEWTLLVYLDADNNLEAYGIGDFLQMSSVGSSTDVQIVVLLDRISGEDDTYGDWTDTQRGLVRPGDAPGASWGESIGEANMGDPQTLISFARWGIQNYPASRYGLVLWDHGNGWWPVRAGAVRRPRGVCWDDTDNNDALSMEELREALAAITSTDGPVDLLGFDACLMGMVEVACDIRPYGSVMVAAETSEVGYGWPYDSILEALLGNPSMTAAQLGTVIVDDYHASVQNLPVGTTDLWSLSAIDLSQMETLVDEVGSLAQALRADGSSGCDSCSDAAADVMTAIDSAVIHEKHWPLSLRSHGLAVYFPQTSDEFASTYNESVILLPAVTQWEEFLSDFYSSMAGSSVAQARAQAQECDSYYFEHVDLYDFCSKLAAATGGDRDGDGVPDATDGCPNDAQKDAPGQCGCGVADTDGDGDGTADCVDGCPDDPAKTSAGDCGCGVADTDSDGNGVSDCLEELVGGYVEAPPSAVACGAGVADAALFMALVLCGLRVVPRAAEGARSTGRQGEQARGRR